MKNKILLSLAVSALPIISTNGAVPSWPQFRGVNATGVAADAKPPEKFGPGVNEAWQIDLPYAPSSPCIWDDHIFVTVFDDKKLQVRDYSRSTGENNWARGFSVPMFEEFHQTEGSPAASTPATDGKHVVVYFGSFGLACMDFYGNELWVKPMPAAQTSGGFGSGTSPIIVGKTVILARDQIANSVIMAFDIETGKKLWETARSDSPTSYSTPVVWKKNGRTDIVMAGSLLMKGYDAEKGTERWTVRGLPSFTCPTPAVTEDMIFFSGWSPGKADSPWPSWASTVEKSDKDKDGKISVDEYEGGPVWFKSQDADGDGFITKKDWDQIQGLMNKGENVLLAVKPGGAGDVTESNVAWKATRGLPYVPSALHYDGRVYIIKDGGMVSSFDAKTGEAKYAQERIDATGNYYASPVAADGRIFVASQNGRVTVFKAGGLKPEIVHHADFKEKIPATMALIGENIYLRTQTKMYSFGPKAKK
jgi:outer membrane protein assembly factor BamB